MKQLLKIIIVTLCVLPIYSKAQSVKYFDGTVYEALDQARREKKMLIVEFYASWSHKSSWMHDIIAKTENLDKHYIISVIDTGTKEGAGLAVQYSVNDYPFIIVFNNYGDPIDKIDRALSKEDFEARLTAIRLSSDRESIGKLNQIYTIATSPSLASKEAFEKIVNDYLLTQNLEHLLSNTHWDIFASSVITQYNNGAYKFLLKHQAQFQEPEDAKNRICEIVYDTIIPYIIGIEELRKSEELFSVLEQDSATIAVVPSIERLIELARLRVKGYEADYVRLLGDVVSEIDENYEYPLIMSLDFVADSVDNIDKSTKSAARKLVEKLRQKSLSSAKMLLIEALLAKFS